MEEGGQHAEPEDAFRLPSAELFKRFVEKVSGSFSCAPMNAAYPWESQERAATGLLSDVELEKAFVSAARQKLGCS